MFERAKQIGLDGLGFTDGPDLEHLEEIRAAAKETGVLAFCGCAVATNRGVLLCFVPEVEALRTDGAALRGSDDKLPAANDVIATIDALGGAVIAAHPYYKAIPSPMGDHIFSLAGLHACEAASPLATGIQRDLAIEASESLALPCIGGSAARTPEHIGMAATFIPEEVTSEADLCRMIREKKCFALMALDELPSNAHPSSPAQRPRYQRGRGRGRGRRPPPRR